MWLFLGVRFGQRINIDCTDGWSGGIRSGHSGTMSAEAGLLIAVAPHYRYCSGATFTVAVAVAPLLLAESSTASSSDSSAATF